ncbi:hypothetical protein [Trichloromonas sp.]|uniref:hypothetical protein n=1 Tax=Trichloromonas sp. TaxID=3069249 RepID=UPI001DA2894D|nr:hypothetical protein [Desulfuromonadaceae bacterium]MDY0269076.1 hypothetical protein [Trichloromonas sp.]
MGKTMIVDDIECEQVEFGTRKREPRQLYATIPLDWIKDLPGESRKVKLITILWCYSSLKGGGWFSCGNKVCERYGISPSQKSRILASLEKSGHLELKLSPGKAVQVKLTKPLGWK